MKYKMKPVYCLDNWSVGMDLDPYRAPELSELHLSGIRNGKPIITSKIIKASGIRIETKNSVYILQGADPGYMNFLKENGIEFDPNNPIKIKA